MARASAQSIKLAGGVGAEQIGIGRDAHSAQVEPIGVPAHLKGDVPIGQAVGMQPAGFMKQLEIGVWQIESACRATTWPDFAPRCP